MDEEGREGVVRRVGEEGPKIEGTEKEGGERWTRGE